MRTAMDFIKLNLGGCTVASVGGHKCTK